MISRVQFENFKALQQVSIDLERLTVFVGANATGKTSVLEALDLLTRLASHQHQEDTKTNGRFGRVLVGRDAPGRLLTLGATAGLSVEIAGDVAVAFKADPRGPECTYLIAGGGKIATYPQPSSSSLREVFSALETSGLGRAMRLRLDPSRLGEPSYVDDLTPRVAADGFGLASVLAAASGGRSAALSRIEADLRRIVPRARKLLTSPARVERTEVDLITVNGKTLENQVNRTYVGQRFELELDGIGPVPADMLSEGTLLVLGLLTVLHTTPGLRLLLLAAEQRRTRCPHPQPAGRPRDLAKERCRRWPRRLPRSGARQARPAVQRPRAVRTRARRSAIHSSTSTPTESSAPPSTNTGACPPARAICAARPLLRALPASST